MRDSLTAIIDARLDQALQPFYEQIEMFWGAHDAAGEREAKAWRWIAQERADNPRRFRKAGLCYQVMDLYERRLINHQLAKWMLSRIYHRMPLNEKTGRFAMHAYRKKEQRWAHEARIIAALWFAEEAKCRP